MTATPEELHRIVELADATSPDRHMTTSAWVDAATPAVVKAMALEIERLRELAEAVKRARWVTDVYGVTRCPACRNARGNPTGNDHTHGCPMGHISKALDAALTPSPTPEGEGSGAAGKS